MLRKKRGFVSGFDQTVYDKVAMKLSRLSVRELLNQFDQYMNEMVMDATAHQHQNREEYLLGMKRSLITLMAIVDELHDEHKARKARV